MEEKIDRNEILLYKGTEASAASISTRWLKLSQLRSRLRYTVFFSSMVFGLATKIMEIFYVSYLLPVASYQ